MPEQELDADKLVHDLYEAPLQQFAEEAGFYLDEVERSSRVWLKIEQNLRKTLQNLRISNDIPTSEVETSELRGKIALVKEFLTWGEDPGSGEDPDSPDLGY